MGTLKTFDRSAPGLALTRNVATADWHGPVAANEPRYTKKGLYHGAFGDPVSTYTIPVGYGEVLGAGRLDNGKTRVVVRSTPGGSEAGNDQALAFLDFASDGTYTEAFERASQSGNGRNLAAPARWDIRAYEKDGTGDDDAQSFSPFNAIVMPCGRVFMLCKRFVPITGTDWTSGNKQKGIGIIYTDDGVAWTVMDLRQPSEVTYLDNQNYGSPASMALWNPFGDGEYWITWTDYTSAPTSASATEPYEFCSYGWFPLELEFDGDIGHYEPKPTARLTIHVPPLAAGAISTSDYMQAHACSIARAEPDNPLSRELAVVGVLDSATCLWRLTFTSAGGYADADNWDVSAMFGYGGQPDSGIIPFGSGGAITQTTGWSSPTARTNETLHSDGYLLGPSSVTKANDGVITARPWPCFAWPYDRSLVGMGADVQEYGVYAVRGDQERASYVRGWPHRPNTGTIRDTYQKLNVRNSIVSSFCVNDAADPLSPIVCPHFADYTQDTTTRRVPRMYPFSEQNPSAERTVFGIWSFDGGETWGHFIAPSGYAHGGALTRTHFITYQPEGTTIAAFKVPAIIEAEALSVGPGGENWWVPEFDNIATGDAAEWTLCPVIGGTFRDPDDTSLVISLDIPHVVAAGKMYRVKFAAANTTPWPTNNRFARVPTRPEGVSSPTASWLHNSASAPTYTDTISPSNPSVALMRAWVLDIAHQANSQHVADGVPPAARTLQFAPSSWTASDALVPPLERHLTGEWSLITIITDQLTYGGSANGDAVHVSVLNNTDSTAPGYPLHAYIYVDGCSYEEDDHDFLPGYPMPGFADTTQPSTRRPAVNSLRVQYPDEQGVVTVGNLGTSWTAAIAGRVPLDSWDFMVPQSTRIANEFPLLGITDEDGSKYVALVASPTMFHDASINKRPTILMRSFDSTAVDTHASDDAGLKYATLALPGTTSGTMTLTIGGVTTGSITYSATDATMASNIQTAIRALTGQSTATVSVFTTKTFSITLDTAAAITGSFGSLTTTGVCSVSQPTGVMLWRGTPFVGVIRCDGTALTLDLAVAGKRLPTVTETLSGRLAGLTPDRLLLGSDGTAVGATDIARVGARSGVLTDEQVDAIIEGQSESAWGVFRTLGGGERERDRNRSF